MILIMINYKLVRYVHEGAVNMNKNARQTFELIHQEKEKKFH